MALQRDRILEAAEAGLAKHFETNGSMPTEAREAKLLELEERLLAVEIREEQAIRDAEAHGVAILRRPDADPAIVFAIDLGGVRLAA